MDTTSFVKAIGKSGLPFLYSGDKLQDEKCQKALKKIGGEGTVLGAIMGNALVGLEGLVVTDKGIWFSISTGATGEMKLPKTKGAFPFDEFILHSVTVKKAFLPKFDVEFVMFDIKKAKSFTFMFGLTQDNLNFEESMTGELEGIFKTLVSTTGTEYVEKTETSEAAAPKDPNTFDFVSGSLHTTLTINDTSIVIKKQKIDDKTKIQTPKGEPITISRSAIGSVKIKRTFTPVPLLLCMGGGALIGFALIGGVITLLIFTVLGLVLSFPKTMFIYRKDGTKFKTVISGDEENTKEYDRLMNIIFQ
jgi:RNase P/RNase MRP subunit p29